MERYATVVYRIHTWRIYVYNVALVWYPHKDSAQDKIGAIFRLLARSIIHAHAMYMDVCHLHVL